MPRTIRTKVYKFNELSESGKEKAIEWYRNGSDDAEIYSGEIIDSIKAVAKLFDLKFGREYTDIRTSHIDDSILKLQGARLYKYIINNYSRDWIKANYISKHTDGSIKNSDFQYKYDCVKYRKSRISVTNNLENCPLTGVCYDMDIMQPVIDFLKKPNTSTNFEDLMQEIEGAISKTFDNNEEWVNSAEFITENIVANEYEFTIDGERF